MIRGPAAAWSASTVKGCTIDAWSVGAGGRAFARTGYNERVIRRWPRLSSGAPRSMAGRDAAVVHERRPRGVPGLLPSEIEDRAGALIDRADAPERRRRLDVIVERIITRELVLVLDHRRLDPARTQAVDPDAVLGQGEGQHARHLHHAALRGAIDRGGVGAARDAQHGGHVDDRALGLAQGREGIFRAEEGALEIEREHHLPVALGRVLDQHVVAAAGVVDQDVEPAHRLDRVVHQALAVRDLREIAGRRGEAGTAAHLLDHLPDAVGLAAVDGYGRAELVKTVRGAPADAHGAARDQHLLPGEIHAHAHDRSPARMAPNRRAQLFAPPQPALP